MLKSTVNYRTWLGNLGLKCKNTRKHRTNILLLCIYTVRMYIRHYLGNSCCVAEFDYFQYAYRSKDHKTVGHKTIFSTQVVLEPGVFFCHTWTVFYTAFARVFNVGMSLPPPARPPPNPNTHLPAGRWPRSAPSRHRPGAPDIGICRSRPGRPTPAAVRPAAPGPLSPGRPCTTWSSAAHPQPTWTSCTAAPSARSGRPWPWPGSPAQTATSVRS